VAIPESAGIPNAEELGRLSLRAVAAYALRTARRVAGHFWDQLDEHTVRDALSACEAVISTDALDSLDAGLPLECASRLLDGGIASDTDASRTAATSISSCAITAHFVLQAACTKESTAIVRDALHATRAATRTVQRAVRAFSGTDAVTVAEGAISDYETLQVTFLKDQVGVVGYPMRISDVFNMDDG